MFEQTFVQAQAGTRRPWTVAVSLSLQVVVVGVILLIPLLHPAMMRIPGVPQARSISTWANLAPRPVPVAPSATVRTPSTIRVPRVFYPTTPQPSHMARQIDVPAPEGAGSFPYEPALGSTSVLPAAVALP